MTLFFKVIGKFSIRIVPNQTPEIVEDVVVKYCNKIWATRKSPNKMTAKMFHGGRCWLSDPDHPNYVAGARYNQDHGVRRDSFKLIFLIHGSTKPNIEVGDWLDQTKIFITHIAFSKNYQHIPPYYMALGIITQGADF